MITDKSLRIKKNLLYSNKYKCYQESAVIHIGYSILYLNSLD